MCILTTLNLFSSNPNGKEFTVSLWVKVVTPQSGSQILVGSGKKGDNTGLFIRVKTSATVIEIYRMTTTTYLTINKAIGDALRSWAHIAIVNVDGPGREIKYSGYSKSLVRNNP